MKQLYLHIGAGKTGSSALQVWLHEHVKTLKKQNIVYPLFSHKIKNEYQITSGNGVFLYKSIQEQTLDTFFTGDMKENNVLFSSEVFQNLTLDELHYLKESIEGRYEVKIILYMRNLYDVLFSSYQQLIKRHLYSDSFEYFIKNINSIQQFNVLNKYEKIFEKIDVIHYNSHKESGIDKPFCEILNVQLPSMKKNKVNRSLNAFEIEILKKTNLVYKKEFNHTDFSFSAQLSDALIYNNPEKQTEVYFRPKLINLLKRQFQLEIDTINKKYLENNVLTIFEKDRLVLAEKIENIPNEYPIVLDAIFKFIKSKSNLVVEKEKKFDLIGILIQEAKKRKENDIQGAIDIVKAASILRPEGEKIKDLLEEYINIEKDYDSIK